MRPVAQIAQSVEQGIENPRVGGSIPSLGTTFSFDVVSTTTSKPTKNPPCAGFLLPVVFVKRLGTARHQRSSLTTPVELQVMHSSTFDLRVTSLFLTTASGDDKVFTRRQLNENNGADLTQRQY